MADLKQTLVWVAVPNGFTDQTGKTLRLSVIAYPRLFVLENGQPAAGTVPLDQFRDFLQWPGHSEGVQFDVQFGASTSVKAKRVSRKPDMPSWQLLFDRDTPVECYTQPRTVTESTLSFPAAAMYSFLKQQYQKAGQEHPWSPPLAEQLAQNFIPVARAIFGQNQPSPLLHEVYETFRGGANPKNYVDDRNYPADNARDWMLAKLFFRPPQVDLHVDNTASYSNPDPVDPGEGTSTTPEFHKQIAFLGFHADLMRLYGLVIDLEVDKPAGMTADSFVRVVPKWNPTSKVPTTNATPITHFGHATFLPRPQSHNPEDIAADMIDLTGDRYQVVQADLDSGLVGLQKLVERLAPQAGERVTLPQLASGGLILMRKSPAQRLVEQRKAFNANYDTRIGNPGQLEVYAEDLLMGYRLDVWSDRANRWHSLHRRNATYKFTRNNKPVYLEFVNEGWINPTFGILTDGLVSENMLSPFLARWTGWSLSASQDPEDDVDVDENMKFGVRHGVVAGSLPWLRFGTTYRLRMRTVNLAGNGQAFTADGAPDFRSTPVLTYRRFEPVRVPLVIPRAEPVADLGESVTRLVIRDTEPTKAAERHIAPPQTTVDVCEQHGLFDTTTGVDPDKLEEAETREDVTVPGIVAGDEVTVDYLPDYFARGASLINLPGASGPVRVEFGQTFPQRRSFRLRVEPGTGAPTWSGRVLTVYLPPAEVARVKLASCFDETDLDTMALWHWLAEELSGSELAQMRQGILEGRHWAVTPSNDLVLVHAVKQPLAAPVFDRLGALRGEGDTAATFSGVINVHGKSTGKVEVTVQWVEPVDDPAEADGPEFIGGTGHAFEAPVRSPDATTLDVANSFDFRDTKYRRVQVTATGTTRFTDFFATDETLTSEGSPIEVDVLNTARPAAPRIQYVVPTFGWEQPPKRADGTISRTRWGGGLRVYLDRPWYSSGDGEMLAVILYDEKRSSFFRRPEPSDQVQPWVTVWGSDPLWKSGDTYPYPKPEHFKSALVTQTGLTLKDVLGAEHVSAGENPPIVVAGHSVKYDTDSRRWYCDIELDAGPTYFPFIRLALARFQPRSVSGCHLSPIVTADIVQTAPHRTATINRSGTKVSVAVAGQTYQAGRAGSAVVRVSVEKATAHEGILAWTGENLQLTPSGSPVSYATLDREGLVWTGSFYLQATPTASQPHRLVIREYERFLSDSGVAERLVYADMIEID